MSLVDTADHCPIHDADLSHLSSADRVWLGRACVDLHQTMNAYRKMRRQVSIGARSQEEADRVKRSADRLRDKMHRLVHGLPEAELELPALWPPATS